MPTSVAEDPAALLGPRRRALGALCVSEVVSYGVLYYAFPVLAADISADTGWSRTAITAAFSAGNLIGAGVGIPAGRLIERHGPRLVMTGGSLLAVIALAGIALAPDFGWFLTAWLIAGVAMAGVFYPPAFAALTGWYGPDRVRALTTLTLAAGFASTIFAPLTAALAEQLSWRSVYLILAGVLAVTTIPVHWLGLRLPWSTPAGPTSDSPKPAGHDPRRVVASRRFLVLVAAMTLSAFALYAVVVNLVPLLTGRGLSPTLAAWAIGLGGAGQVAGRLCYRLLGRLSVRARTIAIMLAGSGSTLLLAVLPGPAGLLVVLAVLGGAVRGVFTLLEATIVSDHWGPARYASLNGVFNAPLTAATALAPSLGAALVPLLGGYPALFVLLAGAGVLGAVCAATVKPAENPDALIRATLPSTSTQLIRLPAAKESS